MADMISRFQTLLESGQDSPMLRLSLGNALIAAGRHAEAVGHLERALDQDPGYSAAWKRLGWTLLETGAAARALEVCERGIEVARGRGDLQAAKEMEVFARRARKQLDAPKRDS
ncbi:TPR repeat protein [Thioalkalivibrio nitratireducens DSM 14787]|uniref:TPR repeat protein n=1 Tax=Thioalkalivibrio nitratireducens (strain DSM 14787 / UNIQEM 213 / ALEN2) TaxID=1255043 RepID=L0DRB2_THIND|nr:tetratricopeptide repeat protein [Thioalkalivibrio nitratireducens]AGA32129.1 TPR repeat protein [Thioalkalivibrio nitratireducens DSM 14787]